MITPALVAGMGSTGESKKNICVF